MDYGVPLKQGLLRKRLVDLFFFGRQVKPQVVTDKLVYRIKLSACLLRLPACVRACVRALEMETKS